MIKTPMLISGIFLIFALFFSGGNPALADLEISESALELKSEQVLRWPLSAGDHLVVRPCPDCGLVTLEITEQTRYATDFDTASVTLAELLRQKSLLCNDSACLIAVFFRPDDRRVTRLILQTEF